MFLEKLQKIKIVDGILVLGFLLVIIGIGMNFKDQFLEKAQVEVTTKGITPTIKVDIQSNNEVTIDIAGEVIKPGVYKLKGESRINDALVMAGGLGAKADRDWVEKNLNQAEKLVDGQKIFIPKIGENVEIKTQVLGSSVSKIIRINTATVEDLDKLSGVGPSIAQRIIDYRTKNGGFKNIEELKLVSGIGDKMFEKIKDEIAL
ncbi:MAG: helix-hairpin-helix domain-containing protein [Candidatus Shapirobacteria bacterium]|jgi:competence protein ComEA